MDCIWKVGEMEEIRIIFRFKLEQISMNGDVILYDGSPRRNGGIFWRGETDEMTSFNLTFRVKEAN